MENKELLEVLGRIANALEEIKQRQDVISTSAANLNECIAYIPPMYKGSKGYYILRIGGAVQTD